MPGLSAKVFRTYNASWTFQEQLKNTPEDGTVAEKIAAYNTANRMVAILCNHQKTVSKGFDESFAKMGDKVRVTFTARGMLLTIAAPGP
jgi:DNA topoisomerase-1